MKQIINKKVYDTDSAKELGRHGYGYPGDFERYSETLYRKDSGEFFLYGEGGPMSAYCRQVGTNEWSGGEEITPMSPEEAREWAEKHLDADDYIAIFGMPDEDDGYQTITVKLNTDTYSKLKMKAKKAGLDISAFVSQLVSETV